MQHTRIITAIDKPVCTSAHWVSWNEGTLLAAQFSLAKGLLFEWRPAGLYLNFGWSCNLEEFSNETINLPEEPGLLSLFQQIESQP